jgi:hypothetical protein
MFGEFLKKHAIAMKNVPKRITPEAINISLASLMLQ